MGQYVVNPSTPGALERRQTRACRLRCSGARITHSSRTNAGAPNEPTDLVVLTDFLVSDPRVVRDLHAAGVPHLPVRVRDGTGLVGPLVVPGVTSCLGNH